MDTEEIEHAFADYQDTVADIARTGEWSRFADMFTPDATYENTPTARSPVARRSARGWSGR